MGDISGDDTAGGKAGPATAKTRAGQARRLALIERTREQIFSVGPHNVSLAEVLRLAGGSKATVVKYFGDRNGLIAAALQHEAEQTMDRIVVEQVPGEPFEQALTRFLAAVIRFYLEPESVVIYRGIVAAGATQPGVAAGFYEGGHARIVEGLTGFLESWVGRGVSADTDRHAVASVLIHAIRGGLIEEVLLGLRPLPVDDALIIARAGLVARIAVHGLA